MSNDKCLTFLTTLSCIIIDEYIKRLLSAENFTVSDVVGAELCCEETRGLLKECQIVYRNNSITLRTIQQCLKRIYLAPGAQS